MIEKGPPKQNNQGIFESIKYGVYKGVSQQGFGNPYNNSASNSSNPYMSMNSSNNSGQYPTNSNE